MAAGMVEPPAAAEQQQEQQQREEERQEDAQGAGSSQQQDESMKDAAGGSQGSQEQAGNGYGGQDIQEFPEGMPGAANEPGPKYKRGRGRSFFKEQPKKGAVCQVPGCDRSLHKLRDYYKRYKICPYHLELPCLVVEGQTIRFCQQCGRFQLLSDFEGDRRSCRRKLDKHNERRRKAEAEQKARMMDSGSDSPLSGRGPKAHRVSPQRAGKGGYAANHAALMMGAPMGAPGLLGGPLGGLGPFGPGEMGSRLQALAGEPGMADLPPGLLQTLGQPPAVGGMDWLAAGSLTNMAMGARGAPPPPLPPALPPVAPALPPEIMALLPAEVQQQVQQQGTGVLDGALVAQLQQLAPQLAPPAAPQPPQPAGLNLGGFLGSPPAALEPQPSYRQPPRPAAALPPAAASQPASVFLQQQQQQPAPALGASPGGVPLLRSEPVPAPKPEPSAAAAALAAAPESSDKAALLVALAKSVGVSNEELAWALMGGQGGAPALPSPSDGAPQPSSSQMRGADVRAPHLPLRQASDSLARPSSSAPNGNPDGLLPISCALDSSGPASSLGGATSLHTQAGQLQPAPQSAFGGVFRPVVGGQAAPAAGPSPPAPAQAAAGPSRQPLDLDQLQSAVQNAGLNPGFASDASLLLQLVAAVEAAQRQAVPGKDRMHTLCVKLFNCTPDSLPSNILEQLGSWVAQNSTLLEGATRPGCVQVALSALLSSEEAAGLSANFAGMVEGMASGSLGGARTSVLAQLDGQAALVDSNNRQLARLDLEGSAAILPQICSVRPLAMTLAYDGPIMVTGRNIGGSADTLYCRNGGAYPTTEILGRGPLLTSSDGDRSWVLMRVPHLLEGCHEVEAQRGVLLSAPQPFLVVDDAAAVAELRQLEQPGLCEAEAAELLQRLGAVLRFARQHQRQGGAADAAVVARVAAAAQELAAGCITRGWSAVLQLVMPAACLGCTAEEAVAGVEAHLGGIPLLHAAALMGGAKVVCSLGAWAAAAGCPLHPEARWGGGLTALHVATLLREPEEVALALTGLCPDDSPELWAAACCSHDEETPLGLACRMNKRGLLAALAVHGVPAAGAMLAALQLQDRRVLQPVAALAAAVSGKRGKAGAQQLLTTRAEEESLQQEEWAKLLCTQPAAACKGSVPVDGLTAGNVLKHVPASAAEPGRFSHAAATAAPLLAGAKLPDSVLPLRTLPGCCSACSAMDLLSAHSGKGKCVHAHSLSSGSSSTSDSESSDGDGDWRASLAALHKSVGRKDGAASFYLPYQAEQLEQCQLASSHFKGGSPLWAFRDGTLERSFRTWHMGEVAKLDTTVCLMVVLLLCAVASMSPNEMRRPLHLWLLTTVARAPLMLQPVLLLCPPARAAYRRCRDGLLLALHVAVFVLQYWWPSHMGSAEWVAGGSVLASQPAGLWLLIAVFTLQLRFALQVPALLLVYVANVALLPEACRERLGGGVDSLSACVAIGGVRLFAISVVLPLLAVWMVEARARQAFVALRTGRPHAAALSTCL